MSVAAADTTIVAVPGTVSEDGVMVAVVPAGTLNETGPVKADVLSSRRVTLAVVPGWSAR